MLSVVTKIFETNYEIYRKLFIFYRLEILLRNEIFIEICYISIMHIYME